MTLRSRGDYGYRPIVDVFEPAVDDGAPHRTYFGLPLTNTWIYGTWRDRDGRPFQVHRTVLALDASVGVHLNEPRDGALRHYHAPKDRPFASGMVVNTVTADAHTIQSRPAEADYSSGQPFRCTRTADGIEYTEGDAFGFEGRRIGPGLQFYVPGGRHPMLYVSHQFRVSGESFGVAAEGFLWWDQCYLPPGVSWRGSEYFGRVEQGWNVFGTEFDDGSMELGHACYGADGFNFSAIVDERGELLHCTTDVAGTDIKAKPSGFPERVRYRIDGVDWDWVTDDIGDLPDMASGSSTYRSAEGVFTRSGETRTPVVWCAYNEFIPGNMKDGV